MTDQSKLSFWMKMWLKKLAVFIVVAVACVAASGSNIYAATYACAGWLYSDGTGDRTKVSKFVVSPEGISLDGVPLKITGGRKSKFGDTFDSYLLTQDTAKDSSSYMKSFTFLLRTCTGENDILESKSEFECKHHDLVRLDDVFIYPNLPLLSEITRCIKF